MKYLLLIHADEAAYAAAGEEAIKAMYAEYGRFTQELAAAGKLGPPRSSNPATRRAWCASVTARR